jgi:uncharacterized protein (DUF58 family)
MPGLRIPIANKRPNVTVTVNMIWPVMLAIGLAFTQLVFPSRVWVVLLWMLGGILALGYVWARQLAQHLSSWRELRFGWMQVGDRLEERFTLTNDAWLPVLWTDVLDESDLPGYQANRVASCPAQSTVHWTTDQDCARRGVYTLGPWSLRVSDPFGFFSITFRHDKTEVIVVYPPVVDLPEIALPRGLIAGPSRARRQTTEATIEASHTRFYRPRDPLRNIHWPSTAHRGTLIVRDPDTEISGDLWVVLDLDHRVQAGEQDESTEEYGIILAASLADRTMRQNRAVGLLAHGTDLSFVPPGHGRGHMWRILQALALAKAGGTQSLSEVLHHLRQSLGQGASVLVITPSDATDWVDALMPLTRSGIASTAVLLDRVSFLSERGPSPIGKVSPSGDSAPGSGPATVEGGGVEGLRDVLANAGIPSHIIRQGYPFRHLVPLERRGRWEFKTTPMGRAVAVRRPEEA